MPSKRFFKLPEEKRKKIHDAALKEFGEMPMERVSINRIIREAGISRGSFYTYFEDKQDVLDYLVEDSLEKRDAFIKQCVTDCGGDFFKAMDALLDYTLIRFRELGMISFEKHMALRDGFNPIAANPQQLEETETKKRALAEWLFQNIDKNKLNIPDAETMRAVMLQSNINIMLAIGTSCLFPEKEQEVRRVYNTMMRILREGVMKR